MSRWSVFGAFICLILISQGGTAHGSRIVYQDLEDVLTPDVLIVEVQLGEGEVERRDIGSSVLWTYDVAEVTQNLQGELPEGVTEALYRQVKPWRRAPDGSIIRVSPLLPGSGIELRLEPKGRYLLFAHKAPEEGRETLHFFRAEPLSEEARVRELIDALEAPDHE